MSKPDRQIQKVHFNGKRMSVKWINDAGGDHVDTLQMESADNPAEGFIEALAKLKPYIGLFLELPESVQEPWLRSVVVRGLTMTYSGERMGVSITAIKRLGTSNRPFNIHTPVKFDEPGAGEDAEVCLPEKAIPLIQKVLDQAEEYLDGRRSQEALPFEGEDPEAQEDEESDEEPQEEPEAQEPAEAEDDQQEDPDEPREPRAEGEPRIIGHDRAGQIAKKYGMRVEPTGKGSQKMELVVKKAKNTRGERSLADGQTGLFVLQREDGLYQTAEFIRI